MNRIILFGAFCSLALLVACSNKKPSSGKDVVGDSPSLSALPQAERPPSDTGRQSPSPTEVAWVKPGARECFTTFFSPDGAILVAVSSLGTQIYAVPSGQLLRLLPNHVDFGSYPLVFSHDSKDLYFAESTNLKCWHAASNSISPVLFSQRKIIRSLALSRDGTTLLSIGDDSSVVALNLQDSMRTRQSYKFTAEVRHVQFVDADKFIAVIYGYPNRARIIEVASGKVVRDFKTQGILVSQTSDLIALAWRSKKGLGKYSRLEFQTLSGKSLRSMSFNENEELSDITLTSDGRYLLAFSEGRDLRKYDAATGTLLVTVSDSLYRVHGWSDNGKFSVIGFYPSGFGIWNLDSGTSIAKGSGPTFARLTNLAISEDGRYVVSASSSAELVLWNGSSGIPIRQLTTHNSAVVRIISSGQNQLSASLSEYGIAQVWNTQTGASSYALSLSNDIQIGGLVFSRDGGLLLTNAASVVYDPGSSQGNYHTGEIKISFWQAKTGNWLRDFPYSGDDPPSTLEFSQDDKFLIISNSGRNSVYDSESGKLVKQGGINPDDHGKFSPKGDYTLLDNHPNVGQFELWDVAKDSLLLVRNAHNGFVRTFSWCANEILLVTTGQSDHTLKMWSMPSGQLLRAIDLNIFPACGSVSPSGHFFAGGSIHGDITVWDLQSKEIIQTYNEYPCVVRDVAWSPNEDLILCGFQDGTIIAYRPQLTR